MTKKPDTSIRAAAIRGPRSLDEDNRGFDVIASSENPVLTYDFEHGGLVQEILVASGFSLPRGRKQVPLQDSHDTTTVSATLGSARDFRVEGDTVMASVTFASDPASQRAFDLYKAGHLTDFSVRYSRDKMITVEEGKTKNIGEREYKGPALLVTRWTIKELSPTPIGADERAVARSEAEGAEQPEVIETTQEVEPMPEVINETPITAPPAAPAVDLEQVKREAAATERNRASAIEAACRAAGVADLKDSMVNEGISIDAARARIIDELAKRQPATPVKPVDVRHVADSRDKFRAAAADALAARAVGRRPDQKPAEGADQLSRMGMFAIAQMCLRQGGINPDMMGREEVLQAALGRRSSSSVPALNTGDFTYILADVAHKSMMLGWNYAQTTYQFWCRIGDLMDFKAARRVSLSDAPNLLETPEGAEVQQGVMTNTGESVQLVTYARKLCLPRQALINDDLGAFNTIFRAFGARAANLVNALPYAVLEANAALADGGDLFNATAVTTAGGHANLASTAAISSTTLATGIAAMFSQIAPQGCKLNLMPKFLLTGAAYMTQAQISCGSLALSDATYNSGVLNPFNVLTPIADANVPGNDWFLIADPSVADTVEVAFLDGKRAPTITEEETSPILGVDYTAYIDATAKALDFRGLYKNG